jgi:pimeloyl-ACP methyl ester carboxylesterase
MLDFSSRRGVNTADGSAPDEAGQASPKRNDQRHPPPRIALLALEGRAPWEWGAALASWPVFRFSKNVPRGDGHSVIVYPGLSAGDYSSAPLRAFLKDLGYDSHGWHQGLNFGPRDGLMDALRLQIQQLYARHKRKVSLVGWSLGGIYARELAKLDSEMVRAVVTLGTPFSGHPKSTNAWRLYELLSGESSDDTHKYGPLEDAPPVPTTSLYSRSDGVVAWQCSIQKPSSSNPNIENIEVVASHFGIGLNPVAWFALADRLAQREGKWQPFDASGLKRVFFGTDGHKV